MIRKLSITAAFLLSLALLAAPYAMVPVTG